MYLKAVSPLCKPEKFIEYRIRLYRKDPDADEEELKRFVIFIWGRSRSLGCMQRPHPLTSIDTPTFLASRFTKSGLSTYSCIMWCVKIGTHDRVLVCLKHGFFYSLVQAGLVCLVFS